MRYYNNLRKFEELKSFKRFYAEDPIPGVDVVVEKVPPRNTYVVGINGPIGLTGPAGPWLKEDIEKAYGVTVKGNSLTTSKIKKERFDLKIDPSSKFSPTEFDLQLENLAKTINQNAIALSYVINKISGGISNQVTTQIVDSFAVGTTKKRLTFDIKVDLISPQGEVEEKGWFYSKTETNPNNTNNDGTINLGGGYSSSSISLLAPFGPMPSNLNTVSIVMSSNGVVVACSSADFSELDSDTLYYFRPYVKFVDNDPSEYIFGNVVQLTTPAA